MVKPRAAIAVFTLLLARCAAPAQATLCQTCEATVVDAACTPLRYGEVLPLGATLSIAAACEEISCAPPIPPDTQHHCAVYSRHLQPDYFLVHSPEGSRLTDLFVDSGEKCGEASLLHFGGELPRGTAWIFTRVWGCLANPNNVISYPEEGLVLVTDSDTVGDCDGDGLVSLAEVRVGVNAALDDRWAGVCRLADENDDDDVTIDELILAALNLTADSSMTR